MKYNVVVATHHKTGTVWMDGVFKAIASDLGVQYVNFRSQYGHLAEALKRPFILFNYDSNFREHSHILERDDVRTLHLVRDPRDVLISAMHYHKKSGETWLHEAIPGYDNATYQNKLKTMATKFDQYVFEMEHSTAGTLRDILAWRYDRPNCHEARYEDLRQDLQLRYWRKVSAFLGFDEAEQQISIRRFWKNSLFGGLPRLGNKHIRSGDVAQWRREFTVELAFAFLKRFPSALQALGYETDTRWVGELKGRAANEVSSVLKRLVINRWETFADLARSSSAS